MLTTAHMLVDMSANEQQTHTTTRQGLCQGYSDTKHGTLPIGAA